MLVEDMKPIYKYNFNINMIYSFISSYMHTLLSMAIRKPLAWVENLIKWYFAHYNIGYMRKIYINVKIEYSVVLSLNQRKKLQYKDKRQVSSKINSRK